MKQIVYFLIFSFGLNIHGQKKEVNLNSFQIDYFYGNIIKHNKNVGHFLTGHPEGFLLSWNKKTIGKNNWESVFNYPDVGLSFSYQDFKNPILGKLYSLYGHYNFYLLPKTKTNQLVFSSGWGISYTTNPYHKVSNPKNVAFGSTLNSSIFFKLFYKREHLYKNIGFNAGFTFIHASNASTKSPNTGINSWASAIGINYNFEDSNKIAYLTSSDKTNYKEPIKYNFSLLFGANESNFIGSGIKPFYVFSIYADKRIGRKSAFQFGGDFFISYMIKDYINIKKNINPNYTTGDFKRASLFIGHEFFINKLSVISQLGYYVYYPVEIEGRIYERIGLKHYFNQKWFASLTLKAHMAKAENFALGIGVRL